MTEFLQPLNDSNFSLLPYSLILTELEQVFFNVLRSSQANHTRSGLSVVHSSAVSITVS